MTQKRKRGRPKKSDDSAKRYPLGMRTTREIRKKIEKAAKASGRSLSAEVEFIINSYFQEQQFSDALIDLRLEIVDLVKELHDEQQKT